MSVELTISEQELFNKALQYGRKNFAPFASKWDKEGIFPVGTFKQTAKDGYIGTLISSKEGGRGLGFLETALIYQAFSRSCLPFTFGIACHSNMAYEISVFDTHESIDQILPDLIKGEKILCYGLTESCAGSDPLSSVSYAVPVKGGFVINGVKNWATNGAEASYVDLTVKIGSPKSREMYTFLVDIPSKGLTVGRNLPKMGANLLSTVEIKFENCFVPEERVLTKNGYKDALWSIKIARIFVSAMAIGLCEEIIHQTADYLGKRVQFGKPLLRNQALQWRLADMMARVEAGKWLTYRAATLMDRGESPNLEASMAKTYCADLAVEVTVACAQLFGANGYCTDYPAERFIREARALQIVDGTSEIQKLIIGKSIEKKYVPNEKE